MPEMGLQRESLPIPDVLQASPPSYDAKDPDTRYPPIRTLRPPEGAPNIIIALIDDVGFGAASAFGGPSRTPNFEKLAAGGLKLNRFHTTALCSPTRAALLSGRNHHSVGMGGITETATSAPGYNSMRPNTKAALAEVLRLNGYATAQFGKCHEVPVWETSPAGPFDHWPSPGGGFEYFYGFIGGETNQYYPAIYENTTPIETPKTPEQGYHFTEDMTDRSIAWIRQSAALQPDRPFFLYWAPGATHAPHQVPPEWADRYKGEFDDGWDVLRERTFARQKELGVIPPDALLTRRHDEIPSWDEMDEDLKPVLRRQMEVYAAFLEHTDHHFGRLMDALTELGMLEDTLVFLIIGDNGASAEGTLQGTFNEMINFNGFGHFESIDFLRDRIDKLGGPESYNHYAVGWAHALCTPYQWTKQVASHFGGTRNGTVVHWPTRFASMGMRNQFFHVIDIAPTILEAAGLPEPTEVHGVLQSPIEGTSMLYALDDAAAPERHETQYFEMFGNRGIYHKGWMAVTKHHTPWELIGGHNVAFDDDIWELYDTTNDWSQAHDLAADQPARLHELQRLFLIEVAKYNVLPLDDRTAERVNSDIAGRPVLVKGNHQVLFAGMGHLNENCVLNLKNKSHSVTAEVVLNGGDATGVIVGQGGIGGGWSLYARNGRPKYCYNLLGLQQFYVEAEKAIPAGKHQVRMEFAYDGDGLAKGGSVALYIDGDPVGTGRIDATEPMIFSADETTDVGRDTGSPVTPDYGTDNAFNGEINWVALDISSDDQSHLLSPEDQFRIAMARQ